MALNDPQQTGDDVAFDETIIEGPSGDGDPMGTPAADERVIWQGQPDLAVLARSAFHTRKVAIYFGLLIVIALVSGNVNSAIVCAVLGVAGLAVLQGLAWLSRRTTVYILTDTRLIMRIGMALETRINVPLKHVRSAQLKDRGNGHGDIALQLGGERLLGYALMWPHVRPWRFAMPQPMLRAVPDAQKVAGLLADACAKHAPIERELTQITATGEREHKQVNGPASVADRSNGLEGAPA